jgi:hypothetical protein
MFTLYSEIRNEIRTGDLLIWKTTVVEDFFDFFLLVYQKIFKAQWTHMAIVARMDNRVLMVEATPPVSRLFPVSKARDFYWIRVGVEGRDSHVEYLLSMLGRQYSLWDFLRSKFKLKRSANDDYCSDLASEFYNEIGYINDNDAGVTPDSLVAAIVKASGNKPVFVKMDRGNL